MERRDFLKGSTAAVALTSLTRSARAARVDCIKPNLLFLTVDDMNWSLPGFMSSKLGLTPNLDSLAARSHRFVHNRTTAPICQPSREAMMTGRVPHRSGGLGFDPIHEGVPTLTTVLKQNGYYTAAIHKIEHMQPESCFPWDHAVGGKERMPSEYEESVAIAIAEARKRKQPFFINCNINDPHRPFYGSPPAAEVDHNEQGEYHVARELHSSDVEVPSFLERLPDIRTEFAQYCNSAQRMDISIGKVLSVLAAASEAGNTIIIFTADHGMPFPFSKATVYDNGTRTPVLLNFPAMGKPKTFKDRTCNIDYMPTLLELMQVKAPEGMDGTSWVPLIKGRSAYKNGYLVTHVNGVSSGVQYPMRAIQDDRFSLIFTPWSDGKLRLRTESMQGLTFAAMKRAAETDPEAAARVQQYVLGIPLALYDLHSDPDQRLNLIGVAEHAKVAQEMKEALLDYMKRTDDPQTENFQLFLAGKMPLVQQPAVLRPRPE
jgi:N-sulfoglucosamine sulfohydrolase